MTAGATIRRSRTLAEASDIILDCRVVGAGGKVYLAGQETFAVVTVTADGAQVQPQAQLDLLTLALSFRIPNAIGIAPSGRIWAHYGVLSERL